jgi:hypothetical protein
MLDHHSAVLLLSRKNERPPAFVPSALERKDAGGDGSMGTLVLVMRHPAVNMEEDIMGFGRGALLWLLGVPLPVIILLALFWHH